MPFYINFIQNASAVFVSKTKHQFWTFDQNKDYVLKTLQNHFLFIFFFLFLLMFCANSFKQAGVI